MKHDLNVMLFFCKKKEIPKKRNSKLQLKKFWNLEFKILEFVFDYKNKKSLEFLQGFKFLGG